MKKILSSLLIITTVIALGIAGLIWFFSLRGANTNTSEIPVPTQKEPTYSETLEQERKQNSLDSTVFNKAVASRDITLCENIIDGSKKIDCRDAINTIKAESNGDITLCDALAQTGAMTHCRDNVSQQLALQAGNKTLCESITDQNILTHCRETLDESLLRTMIENGTITSGACATLEERFQEECLAVARDHDDQAMYNQALSTENLNYCSLIRDATLRDTCSDTILLKRGLKNSAIDDCNRIKDTSKQAYCLSHISTQNETTLFKEYIATSNLSGCDTLTDISLRNRCHDMVTLSLVRTNKDSSLCQTLTNTGMTSVCEQSAQ